MRVSANTDWTKVLFDEGADGQYVADAIDPEVGCECCGGYAEYAVRDMDSADYSLSCAQCLLESALEPSYPGTLRRR